MMNGKIVVALMLGMCFSAYSSECQAQGFLKKLKNRVENTMVNTVDGAVRGTVNGVVKGVTGGSSKQSKTVDKAKNTATTRTRQRTSSTQRAGTAQRQSRTVSKVTQAKKRITVNLRDGVGPSIRDGRTGGKTPLPPLDVKKSPAWIDALPHVDELTNERLCQENDMLERWVVSGKPTTEPVLVRRELNGDELGTRRKVLERVADCLEEIRRGEDVAENKARLAQMLESKEYKRTVNSPVSVYTSGDNKDEDALCKAIDNNESVEVEVYAGGSSFESGVIDGKNRYFLSPSGDASLDLVDYLSTVNADVTVPSTVSCGGRSYSVVKVNSGAFLRNGVKSVTLPEGLLVIDERAFNDCPNMQTVKFTGNKLNSIGEYAFGGCEFLTHISIPQSVTTMEKGIFAGCYKLRTVDLPDRVEEFGLMMFAECKSLTSVKVPQGVNALGNSMFYNCSALTNVEVPEGVVEYGDACFQNCRSLVKVPLPSTLTKIKGYCFEGCNRITSVVLPSHIEVDMAAFRDCKALSNVTVGKVHQGDVSFFLSTFYGCPFMKGATRTVPKSVKYCE